MARGICDARCQAFRKENIKNEDKLRMQWFIKNRDRLLENLEREDARVREKLRRLQGESPEEIIGDGRILVQDQKPVAVWTRDDIDDLKLMRTVDPQVLHILYDGSEGSHESRKKYLQERKKLAPEDKFFTMDLSSWSYGWKVKDFQSFSPKTFSRRPVIRTSFFRNHLTHLKPEGISVAKDLPKLAKNFNEI